MSYEDEPEVLAGDEPRADFTEIGSLTAGLLLDATNGFDFRPRGAPVPKEGVTERRVDYVLGGENIDAALSRYIGVTIDKYGIQVVMLPFSEAEVATIVPQNDAPDIEIVEGSEADSLISVDFFSHPLDLPGVDVGIRLEGVESQASPDELDELIESIKHPELTELVTSRQTVKYAAITVGVIRESAQAREAAKQDFLARKKIQLIAIAEENETKARSLVERKEEIQAKQAETEEKIRANQAELDELRWKIAHPVRGMLKNVAGRLFSR